MTARSSLNSLLLLLLLQFSYGLAAERPNVVWLLSEDNSTHYVRLFDERGAPMPNVERMAEHGLKYRHAFSNAPVCSVARTTLITGCYAPRIGTQYHRRAVSVPMPEGLKMFPEYLREAGYYTANNNKKDYNAEEGEVWDESSRKASWRNRRAGQPFFYMQSFTTTHESSLHFPAGDFGTKPTQTDPGAVTLAAYHPDTPLFRYTYARYLDNIKTVDRQIGEVISELENDGLLEETFIFYFGDHGGVLPRGKGYAYESGLHIPLVVRVPEKFKHLVEADYGSWVDGFVSFIDFGPTVLNLAGVPVPEQVDGRPFLGQGVNPEEVISRDEAFGYADRFDEKYDLVRTLRKGRFEYVRSYQPFNPDGLQNNYRYIMQAYQQWRNLYREGQLNDVQSQFFRPRAAEALYDLEEDPDEVHNLAGEPAAAAVLAELRSRMQTYVKSLPDLSFYPESELAKKAFENPVAFGQEHRREIGRLVDIADLSLLRFDAARPGIEKALNSNDPWERYWGVIVCSSFGEQAKEFTPQMQEISKRDQEILVRVRAAEYLGLMRQADPRPVMMDALRRSESSLECGLILNSVVLIHDSVPGYPFEVTAGDLHAKDKTGADTIQRRLEYLGGRK